MKKGVFTSAAIGVFALVFAVSSASFGSITKSLIDFTNFQANMNEVVKKDREIHQKAVEKNPAMELTNYGFPLFQFDDGSFDLTNWRIILASSANTVKNNVLSYTKAVNSKRFGTVLGARIHFIQGRFLSWALVQPPFNFFAYYDDGTYVNEGANGEENALSMGVLVNVGQVKSISTWVYGENYQMSVGLRMRDRNNLNTDYFMGSLYFDGWRKLVWMNPEYTDNVQDRIIQRLPLYPKSFPYVSFDSYIIYKPETELGGDFIVYFKDVVMEFDKAIVREELDINDEAEWGILAKDRLEAKVNDMKNIGEKIYLLEQERRRQKASANDAGISR